MEHFSKRTWTTPSSLLVNQLETNAHIAGTKNFYLHGLNSSFIKYSMTCLIMLISKFISTGNSVLTDWAISYSLASGPTSPRHAFHFRLHDGHDVVVRDVEALAVRVRFRIRPLPDLDVPPSSQGASTLTSVVVSIASPVSRHGQRRRERDVFFVTLNVVDRLVQRRRHHCVVRFDVLTWPVLLAVVVMVVM